MILYFSGTGNSSMVAQGLASVMNDHALELSTMPTLPELPQGDSLGFVFPVYAWGIPIILGDFIERKLHTLRQKPAFVWSVVTCGDDIGYADQILNKTLRRVTGWQTDACYSIQMPNTYVCLPGFDIDAPDVAQRKVIAARQKLPEIADLLLQRRCRTDVVRGKSPWIKTHLLRPIFNKWLVTDKYFHVNKERCTSCQSCVKGCPTNNITRDQGTPTWKHSNCTGCLRCYHQCPQRAIEWGQYTKGKGQKASIT